MTPETARTIIDRIAETNANGFTIEFQGGEPLENMPAMRAAVDQAKKRLQTANMKCVWSAIWH